MLTLAGLRDRDLLVMGPKGRGFRKTLHLGSVSEALVQNPSMPLVIARRGVPTTRVLVCADGSADSLAAVAALDGMPWLGQVQILVVAVPEAGLDADGAVHGAADVLLAGARSVRAEVLVPDELQIVVNPRAMLLEAAQRWRADLVVLGTRGLSGSQRSGRIHRHLAGHHRALLGADGAGDVTGPDHRTGDGSGQVDGRRIMDRDATLTFLGGAGTVTGSRFLLDTGASRCWWTAACSRGCASCGGGTGSRSPCPSGARRRGAHPRPPRPLRLPAGAGRARASPGRCCATPGTAELAAIVLRDSAQLQEEDAELRRARRLLQARPAAAALRRATTPSGASRCSGRCDVPRAASRRRRASG